MVYVHYACSICKETFRAPKYAARCQAQGLPGAVYQVGDVLWHGGLLLVSEVKAHHGKEKCPVDGPCQHVVTGYYHHRLYPSRMGTSRAWLSGIGGPYSTPLGLEKLMKLTANWGVVEEGLDPSVYLLGDDIASDWARLWKLYDCPEYSWISR